MKGAKYICLHSYRSNHQNKEPSLKILLINLLQNLLFFHFQDNSTAHTSKIFIKFLHHKDYRRQETRICASCNRTFCSINTHHMQEKTMLLASKSECMCKCACINRLCYKMLLTFFPASTSLTSEPTDRI